MIVHAGAVPTTSRQALALGARALLLALALAGAWTVAQAAAGAPSARAAATCSDYSTQAEAQRAADTRDSDGDGVYCESLPCPCAGPGAGGGGDPSPTLPRRSCSRPRAVQPLVFRRSRYPNIRRHVIRALRRGWPRVLVLNRPGTDERRARLLEGIPTRRGSDRDEYPPAVGRGRPNGRSRALVRGTNPRGWMADVMYVPSRENRSHGSLLGSKLRPFCNGTRFRYVFR